MSVNWVKTSALSPLWRTSSSISPRRCNLWDRSGMQEVEDRPQVEQAVLDRGASQRQAVLRVQLADGARLRRLRILDVLGLVDHDPPPLEAAQQFFVQPSQGERCDDHVMRLARSM